MGNSQGHVVIEDVSKTFNVRSGSDEIDLQVLDGVSTSISDGEIVALTGHSGCGKTTLLRIIMGLEQPTSGRVVVGGNEVTGCGYDRGLVFQHAELLPWRTALENVEFGLEVKGVSKKERRDIARGMLELVGLKSAMDRRPNQLSGGMKQRVGLARALSIDPQVLLMDEPFGALDAQTRETLQMELLRIQQETGKTIVFVTHDLDEALVLADRIILMEPNPGRIRKEFVVDLPRPRTDIARIRGLDSFAKQRYEIWSMLMADVYDSVGSGPAPERAATQGAAR